MTRPIPQPSAVTLLGVEEIRAIVTDAIETALADFVPAPRPALVDRATMARELSISPASLDTLRQRPGFPEVRVLGSPRFELAAVLEWVRAQRVGGS